MRKPNAATRRLIAFLEERAGEPLPWRELDYAREPDDIADDLWELLAERRPELFGRKKRVPRLSAVGYACLYAQTNEPEGLEVIRLTPTEERLRRSLRQALVPLADLEKDWRRLQHLVFNEGTRALTLSWRATRFRYGGAFSRHPSLRRTAIYQQATIERARKRGLGSLFWLLLHEETHLATQLRHPPKPVPEVSRMGEIAAYLAGTYALLYGRKQRPPSLELLDRYTAPDSNLEIFLRFSDDWTSEEAVATALRLAQEPTYRRLKSRARQELSPRGVNPEELFVLLQDPLASEIVSGDGREES